MASRIRILYFAGLKELLGHSEETLELPEELENVADLASHLERIRPELQGRLGPVRFAVNEEFADATRSVTDGDVVALIPPVSGG